MLDGYGIHTLIWDAADAANEAAEAASVCKLGAGGVLTDPNADQGVPPTRRATDAGGGAGRAVRTTRNELAPWRASSHDRAAQINSITPADA